MYINSNLNCTISVEYQFFVLKKVICVIIVVLKSLIPVCFWSLENSLRNFMLSSLHCEDCPEFITQRPKSVTVPHQARKRKCEGTKHAIKQSVLRSSGRNPDRICRPSFRSPGRRRQKMRTLVFGSRKTKSGGEV